jgi:hypothetical protein
MYRGSLLPRFKNPSLADKLLVKYDAASVTKSYVNLSQTASGISGASTITMSSSVAAVVFIGMKIRLNGTDEYTVTDVVTTTVTISGTLSTNYSVGTAAAVEKVSSWTDLSGKGNHATQSTDGNKPRYKPAGINSLPTLKFDSTNNTWLDLPSGFYNKIAGTNIGRQQTIFAVAKQVTQDSLGLILRTDALFLGYTTIGAGSIAYGVTTIIIPGDLTTTNFHIFRGTRSNSNLNVNVDRNAFSTTGTGASANAQTFGSIGRASLGSTHLNGEIAEIQVYNALLSDSDIATIENTLSTKYNITLT